MGVARRYALPCSYSTRQSTWSSVVDIVSVALVETQASADGTLGADAGGLIESVWDVYSPRALAVLALEPVLVRVVSRPVDVDALAQKSSSESRSESSV